MAKRKSYLKKFISCQYLLPAALFIGTSYLVFKLEYPLHEFSNWLLYLARLDPLTLLAYLGATRTMPEWAWLPVLVLITTAFFGRFFCGWLCPVGGMLGLLEQTRRFLPDPLKNNRFRLLPPQALRTLSVLRYFWLTVVVLCFAAGSGLLFMFTPLAFISHEITRLSAGQTPWLFLSAVFGGIVFFPRFWCLYLCPSGILFSLAARFTPYGLKPTGGCRTESGCGLCRKVCPANEAAAVCQNPAQTDCFTCGQCWVACPHGFIKWEKKSKIFSAKDKKARREFILAMTGMAALAFSPFSPKLLPSAQTAPPVLRPPGAIPEEAFLAACARCGRCIKVCPSECLVPMPLAAGLIAFETPRFVPRKGRCELCMLCPKVCAHGALAEITEHEVMLGTAVINETTCLALVENKLCLICAEQCPVQAVIIDENHKPRIDTEKCIGCGACENVCPVDEAAVIVKPVGR